MKAIPNRESRITTAAMAALGVLILAGCGKKEPAGRGYGETPEYRAWKGSQILRQYPAANFAETLGGTLTLYPPEQRSKHPDDFCELFLNGQFVQRFRVGKMANGQWPQLTVNLTLLAGADWLDLWDTSSNQNYRTQIDTRQGTDFVFTPSESGYTLTWTKREN